MIDEEELIRKGILGVIELMAITAKTSLKAIDIDNIIVGFWQERRT